MELCADIHLPYPRERVFAACRDQITALVAYLPDIEQIELMSRTDTGAHVENAVRWQAGASMPMIRAVFGESMFCWTDHARWDAVDLSCDWRTESSALHGALQCAAHDDFLEDGPGKTLVRLRGELSIDPSKLRGWPRPLATRLARMLERYMVQKIKTDMGRTMNALMQHLSKTDASTEAQPDAAVQV